MANPLIPGISAAEQDLLYKMLSIYNQKKASFKEAGALRPLLIVEYNSKRMQNSGDDISSFGIYHGHYLHEILRIDPGYLTWIAFKFTPRIPKQERFVQIA